MFHLFGKNKNSQLTPDSAVKHVAPEESKFSVKTDTAGKILFVSVALKEYLSQHRINDVQQILPKNSPRLYQTLLKTKQPQIHKCEAAAKIWVWEFILLSNKMVMVKLLNANEFEVAPHSEKHNACVNLGDNTLDNVPASLCVTDADAEQIVYVNEKFVQLFGFEKSTLLNISSLINDKKLMQEIHSSLKNNGEVENILFVYKQAGKSFWQNHERYFSINIKRAGQSHDNVLIWNFEDISELKILQGKHQLYKKKFNTAIQAATEGIWEWSKLDEHGDWWSQPMYGLLGLNADSSKPSLEIIKRLMHPKEKKVFDRLIEKDIKTNHCFTMECRLSVRQHGFRWFRLKVVGAFDTHGELNKLIGSLVNIHSEKTNRLQLQKEKDKAVATLNSIVDAVITTNAEGIIEYQNSAAERLTGLHKEEAKGLRIDKALSFYQEHSHNDIANPVITCLETGRRMDHKIYADMLDKDGTRYTVQLMATPLAHQNGEIFGAVMVLNDVTNIRVLSRRLKYQASHDILTKLINRSEFEKRVRNAITNAQQHDVYSAVLFIDLDRFKLINDICGHAAGDELLKQVAKLLRSLVGKNSSVARMGGDEFAVLIENTPIVDVEKIANKILKQLAAYRFSWDEKTFTIECSIGVAEIQSSCEGLTYILNAVDSACYLAKESGRNCIRMYSDGDDTIIERKGQEHWIQHFDKAIENDHLVLYAQPIVSLSQQSDKKASLEILVRMLDDNNNIIPPNAFLPAVERFDRAYKLDRWVIESVFKFISQHQRQIRSLSKISINLSGQSVAEDELLGFIQEKTRQYKVNPGNICFEVTETAAIANLTTAIDLIEQLKQDGFLFALDDFGSGLSSFAYLKTLPVDYLKIDGIFVKDIQTDKVNYAMVKAIHEMSAVLDKKTIAEYVENEAVVELLAEIGVDYGQGFHLGKPAPIENYIADESSLKTFANSAA